MGVAGRSLMAREDGVGYLAFHSHNYVLVNNPVKLYKLILKKKL